MSSELIHCSFMGMRNIFFESPNIVKEERTAGTNISHQIVSHITLKKHPVDRNSEWLKERLLQCLIYVGGFFFCFFFLTQM